MNTKMLAVLDAWVCKNLHPSQLLLHEMQLQPPELLSEWHCSFVSERAAFDDKEALEQFSRNFYSTLVYLSNEVYGYLQMQDNSACRHLYEQVLECLHSFGADILRMHPLLFDPAVEPVSIYAARLFLDSRKETLHRLQETLQQSMPEAQAALLLYPVITLCRPDRKLTRSRLDYAVGLLNHLQEWFGETSYNDTQALLNFCVYENLNSTRCVKHFGEGMQQQLDSQDSNCARRDLLKCWRRDVSHMPENGSYGYNLLKPTFKQQLLAFIATELEYACGDCPGSIAVTEPAIRQALIPAKEKLLDCLPVAQQALLLRVLFDVHAFGAESIKAYLGTFAGILGTEDGKPVSLKSLYNKYWEVEPATKKAVQGLLMDAYNRCREL